MEFERQAQELLAACQERAQKRCEAEVKLLIAKNIPAEEFHKRHELVQSAFEILANADHELRGLAEAELGRVYLEGKRKELASFYLNNGLRVEEELFRKVSSSHILADLAVVQAMSGNSRGELENLLSVLEQATKQGSTPLILDTELKLAEHYRRSHSFALAAKHLQSALDAIDLLLSNNKQPAEMASLNRNRVAILEMLAELGIELADFSQAAPS